MAKFRMRTIILALGMVAGSAATVALRVPTTAVAQQAMGGMNMQMKSNSAGYAEMSEVMKRMMQKMSNGKPTGSQDRDFMMMMIPHHQSAVDMARIELRRGMHPQLRTLARDVIKSQDKEIVEMRGWLKAWYGQPS